MTCNLTTYAQPECDRTRTWPPSLCSHPTWYITLPFYVSSNWRRAVCVTSICQLGAFKKKQWSFFRRDREKLNRKYQKQILFHHRVRTFLKGVRITFPSSLAAGNAFSHSANKHPLWWQKYYRSATRWGAPWWGSSSGSTAASWRVLTGALLPSGHLPGTRFPNLQNDPAGVYQPLRVCPWNISPMRNLHGK